MKSLLPATGSEELLDLLSPFVPDHYLQERWPRGQTGGRRYQFSAAQLYRVHLLVLLTPVHSFNLLVDLLSEQKAWRRFAHLPHRQRVPDVRMLHEFRAQVGVDGVRQINELLLESLLESFQVADSAVAVMDATDLRASCVGSKKNSPSIRPIVRSWVGGRLKVARARGLSVTRSTACGCGCRITGAECF